MRLRLIKEPFDDPDYIFELKHDGFRAIAYIEDGECRLVSRNAKHLKFDSLKKTLSQLPVKSAVLDGEIICLDEHGVSQFNRLLHRQADPIFYAFDLLWLNGEDFRQSPLMERKKQLERFVKSSKCEELLYAQHIETYGRQFFAQICLRDLEGIVAKRKMATYKDSGRNWLKIKNSKYTRADIVLLNVAAHASEELVLFGETGFSKPQPPKRSSRRLRRDRTPSRRVARWLRELTLQKEYGSE